MVVSARNALSTIIIVFLIYIILNLLEMSKSHDVSLHFFVSVDEHRGTTLD